MMAAPFASNPGTVFVVPSAGGPAQPLRSNLTDAGVPQWSEDGSRLIVYGRRDDLVASVGDWNWWVVPFKGGPATDTGAFGVLRAKGFTIGPQAPRIAHWKGNELLFSAQLGDSVNVWKIHIDGSNSRVTGDPQRITSGTGLDAYPSLFADGRLLFATLTSSSDVWILPADTNRAKANGDPRRITETVGPHQFASLSLDGKLLAYSSLRYGRPRAWIKNLDSGAERPVTSGTASENMPQLSPDGSLLAYTSDSENGTGLVVPVRGGPADQFCTNCTSTYDLSPNKVVLYRRGDSIRAFNLVSRREALFMHSADFHLYQHKLSLDGHWVTFEGLYQHRLSRIYVAALKNSETPAPESEWIRITDDEGWADKPRWSPDGNVIYFISNRDGFFCLWAQRVAAGSKRPIGPPIAMAHFHGSRSSMNNVGPGGAMEISVARDKIAFNLGELTGNLWVTNVSR
jgi:eukaryotic-like serine/threonine-protein kinase